MTVQERVLPDLDANPEVRVFGEHTQKRVPVRNLIMMPQVRANLNPEFAALKADIFDTDLLKQPDIVAMSREGLANYIDFVNRIWGSEISIEDYDHMAIDDVYNLVAAGHTRSQAIFEIAEEQDIDHVVVCQVHDTDDPYQIIAIQMRENLHSKPPQERTALAIVESYLLGIEQGDWKNEEEFVEKKGNKFSKEQVKDAVGFARLPSSIRDFVFAGELPYNAALTLGRGSEKIADYTMAQLGYVMIANDEQEERFREAYNETVAILVAGVTNRSLNSTAAKKYLQARIDEYGRTTQKILGVADINEPRIAMATPADQDKIYLRQLSREFSQVMHEVATRPVASTEQALVLYAKLAGNDTTEAQVVARRGRERILRSMGEKGLFDLVIADEVEKELELSGSLFDLEENSESVA